MRKILINSSKIKLLATILLNEAKADKSFFYIAEIEEMPQDYLQIIWPGCKDSDIIAEFKNLVRADDFEEFAVNYDGKNPFLAYSKMVKKSWVVKYVVDLMKKGQIDKNDEAEIKGMLDLVSLNNREFAWQVLRKFNHISAENMETILVALNRMLIPCKSVPLETRQNPAQNP